MHGNPRASKGRKTKARSGHCFDVEACLRKTDYLLKRQVQGYFVPAEIEHFEEIYGSCNAKQKSKKEQTKEIKVSEGLIQQHFELGTLLDEEESQKDTPSTEEKQTDEYMSECSDEVVFVYPGEISSSDYSDMEVSPSRTSVPDTNTSELYNMNAFAVGSSECSDILFNTQELDAAIEQQAVPNIFADSDFSSADQEIPIEFTDDIGPTWEDRRFAKVKHNRTGSVILKTFNTSSSCGEEMIPEFIDDIFHASSATDSDDNHSVSLERIARSGSMRCIKVSRSLPRFEMPVPPLESIEVSPLFD